MMIQDNNSKSNHYFYIVFDYTKELHNIPKDLINILFLRHRLLTELKHDYAKLINSRYDCSYVKSICKGTSKTKIMHISDIHLNNDDINAFDDTDYQMCYKTALKPINTIIKSHNIDFLAITGDIVQGSSSASDAQGKYTNVGRLIKKIAETLWSYNDNGKKILPHDWRRRILIVPGNHDYTAMSDVVVETESRRIKSGFPATRSGGTMSKLTYYIEFLVNFLDAPIDELLDNDMNEIRYYKNFNIRFGLFNTVSKTNALQNNKVGFNNEKIKRLLCNKDWRPQPNINQNVILMHHYPTYPISYFHDKYEPYKYINENNDFFNTFVSLLSDWAESTTFPDEESDEFKKIINALNNNEIFKDKDKYKKSQLCSDVNTFIKLTKGILPNDEFCRDFLSKCQTMKEMQEDDKKHFDDVCKTLLIENTTILGGHVHMNTYEKKEGHDIFVAPKLLDNSIVTYSIVTIDESNVTNTIYKQKANSPSLEHVKCPCEKYKSENKCSHKCIDFGNASTSE